MDKVLKLVITVHTNSHVCESSIREHFADQNNNLIGDWTRIVVEKKEVEPLTATIEQIDGEKNE